MKRIWILFTLVGWAIISYLFLQIDHLTADNERLRTNILALEDHNESSAITMQVTYNELMARNQELADSLQISKKTVRVVSHNVKVQVHDTIEVPIPTSSFTEKVGTSSFTEKLELDTVLQDCYHTNHINVQIDSIFRLSEDLIIKSELSYRTDRQMVYTGKKHTKFGKWLDKVFSRKKTYVSVDRVILQQRNPLILTEDDLRVIEIIH